MEQLLCVTLPVWGKKKKDLESLASTLKCSVWGEMCVNSTYSSLGRTNPSNHKGAGETVLPCDQKAEDLMQLLNHTNDSYSGKAVFILCGNSICIVCSPIAKNEKFYF